MAEREGQPMGNMIHIDEARIRDSLGEMVRGAGGRGLDRGAGHSPFPSQRAALRLYALPAEECSPETTLAPCQTRSGRRMILANPVARDRP